MNSIKATTSKTIRKKQIISKLEKKSKSTRPTKILEKHLGINPATRRKLKVSLKKMMKLGGERSE